MDILFADLGPWTWLILAGVFLFLELASPGVFLMWLGLAAAAVGALSFVHDFAWQADVAIFAALSAILVFLVRPWYATRNAVASDRPNLNQRMYDYVGNTYVLEEPIRDGRGKVRIEDTIWEVLGPDLAGGARVKVTAVEGMRLRVDAG